MRRYQQTTQTSIGRTTPKLSMSTPTVITAERSLYATARPGEDVRVSRGPTRRVQQMIAAGLVAPDELSAANHEADLLAHPYVGVEHLELTRLRLAGKHQEREELRQQLSQGVRPRWWRPRGPRSALRKAGLTATEAARQRAEQDETQAP